MKCSANRWASIVALVMISRRSGRLGKQPVQVAEQEVDVERPLVGFVDDQRVVLIEEAVVLRLGQQHAVGHHLDERLGAGRVGEANLEADLLADRRAQLLGHAGGDRAGRDPPRLRVADHAATPRPISRQILGSCVDLPLPVSPQTTTTWCSRIAAAISSRRATTGSDSS